MIMTVSETGISLEELASAYYAFDNNASEVARELNLKYSDVLEQLKEAGIEIKQGRKTSKGIIFSAYEPSRGNSNRAAEITGYSPKTICKYWKEAGFELSRLRQPSSKDIKIILEAYKPCNGNASEASRKTGYTNYTILKYWKEAGFETRKAGGELLEQEKRRIFSLYRKFNGNAARIARELGCTPMTVLRYLKKEGLKGRGRIKVSENKKQRIIDNYEASGRNASKTAKKFGCSTATVLKIWRENSLEPKERNKS